MGAASTFPKPGRTCRRSGARQLIGEDNDGGGFRLLPHRLEETYFERVPDGWLFAAPRLWWPFGPRPTYLLMDTQKAAVA
jgi:hypothetical protein